MNSSAFLLAVMGLGTPEILLIVFAILLLFGAKKLPELAKGLGKSMNEFKKASSEDDQEKAKPTEKSPPTKSESVEK